MKRCRKCGKKIQGEPIMAKPSRHLTSPNSASWEDPFCSTKCRDIYQKQLYAELAQLDRNASDSECFIGNGWEKKDYTGFDGSILNDHWGAKVRVGRCKITGNQIIVEPLQPGGRSGQPEECYKHFKLRWAYRKHWTKKFKEANNL